MTVSEGSLEGESQNATDLRSLKLSERPNSLNDLFGNRGNSQAPIVRPPPRPAPPKQQRSILNDPGNWGFATPEDVVQEYMSKHVMKIPQFGPDGRDLSDMSPVERYYERQTRGRAPADSAPRANVENIFRQNDAPDPNEMRSIEGLARYGNPHLNENIDRPNGGADWIGQGNSLFSPQAVRERESNLRQTEAFRRALNAGLPSPLPSSQAPVESRQTPAWNNNSGTLGAITSKNPYDAPAGTYNPALASSVPMAPLAPRAPVAPGQLDDTSPVLPSTGIRRGSSRPDFSIPQRQF